MAAVELRNVFKRYGKVQAVTNAEFDCRDKEFLVILGPSGAGKTSTLKMIAGLEEVTEGEIRVGGRVVNWIPPEKRDVSMVFESYALFPHLSVRDNIAFPLRSRASQKAAPMGEDAIKQRVGETADMLQITHLLDRKPAELSGGQKQRVSLGRALARQSELVLMDEPISHLDAKLRHHMRRELKKYQRNLNTTVIYVTHDYLEGLSLADRIVVLHASRVHQIGTPEDVYDRPADTAVASLLGQPRINLIECRIEQGDGEGFLLTSTKQSPFRVPCPADRAEKLLKKGKHEVIAGIRPQYLRLSDDPDGEGFDGRIYVSEMLGLKWVVEVKVGDHLLTVLTERGEDFEIDQPVKAQVPEDHIMFFDTQCDDMNRRKNLFPANAD